MDIDNVQTMFVLVPAFMGLIVLLILLSGVRDLVRGARMTSGGQQTRGAVISAHVRHTGGRNSSSAMVETIEFTTDSGQVVRTNPLRSDVGLLDRTGQTVTVFYDRQRPERMVAPKNGRSMSPGGPLAKSGAALAMLVFLTFFVIISQGMIHRSPF